MRASPIRRTSDLRSGSPDCAGRSRATRGGLNAIIDYRVGHDGETLLAIVFSFAARTFGLRQSLCRSCGTLRKVCRYKLERSLAATSRRGGELSLRGTERKYEHLHQQPRPGFQSTNKHNPCRYRRDRAGRWPAQWIETRAHSELQWSIDDCVWSSARSRWSAANRG